MTDDLCSKVQEAVNVLRNFGEVNLEMTTLLALADRYLKGELVDKECLAYKKDCRFCNKVEPMSEVYLTHFLKHEWKELECIDEVYMERLAKALVGKVGKQGRDKCPVCGKSEGGKASECTRCGGTGKVGDKLSPPLEQGEKYDAREETGGRHELDGSGTAQQPVEEKK